MSETNHAWTLARTPPEGWPTDGDFAWTAQPLPTPGPGQALTRTIYLSLDPYQWARRRSGTEAAGDVCHGRTVSQVLASTHPEFREIIAERNAVLDASFIGTADPAMVEAMRGLVRPIERS